MHHTDVDVDADEDVSVSAACRLDHYRTISLVSEQDGKYCLERVMSHHYHYQYLY